MMNINEMENILKSHSIPIDEEGYSKSFSLEQLDIENKTEGTEENNPFIFFERYGFLVVRDCISEQDCKNTTNEIFDIIESKVPQFKRDDNTTWNNAFADDGSSIPQYGSPSKPPIFKKQFLLNRTNPNVFKVFSKLLGDNKELIVNHDRACFFRPSLINQEWKTRDNVHLDMNPYNWMGDGAACKKELDQLTYARLGEFIVENNQPNQHEGLQLQGVLNLLDNQENDGGYCVTPGFHTIFQEYFNSKKPQYTNPSWNFDKKDIAFKYARRISMRKGSMVVWNQKMPHGSISNKSFNPRMAQFIKIFPSSTVSPTRYQYRKKSIQSILDSNKDLKDFPLNDLSIQLLGLK